jgi:hypothetical protein
MRKSEREVEIENRGQFVPRSHETFVFQLLLATTKEEMEMEMENF